MSDETRQTFHDGECTLQSRVGVRERLAAAGAQLIRDHMPEQHRGFFAKLPFVLAGSVDEQGQPWASVLCKPPGFIHAPDPRRLSIAALPDTTDPLHQTLSRGIDFALLGIEQHTRRRNRANGRVAHVGSTSFEVDVMQSFGNCPKYIQARQVEYSQSAAAPIRLDATALSTAARQIIERADTFFIASAHPQANRGGAGAHGVDVSHRGGKAGFVKIERDEVLVVPDFSGNRFFNTLGNLMLNPRAGLLFMDFASGDVLYLATVVEIVFDGPDVRAFAGAERLVRFRMQSIRHVAAAIPLRWKAEVEVSPFLAQTGSWDDASSSRQSVP